jgi:hypothetical protein
MPPLLRSARADLIHAKPRRREGAKGYRFLFVVSRLRAIQFHFSRGDAEALRLLRSSILNQSGNFAAPATGLGRAANVTPPRLRVNQISE